MEGGRVMQTVILPWPPSVLRPNSRPHRMERARAVKKYRDDAFWRCRGAGIRRLDARRARIVMCFCPPDNRVRDDDGDIGAFKAARDGIATAIGIDDSRRNWVTSYEWGEVRKGGAVLVTIEPLREETA